MKNEMMRLLAVDIGNTSTTFGLFVDGRLKKKCSVFTGDLKKGAKNIVPSDSKKVLDAAIVSSVVPKASSELKELLKKNPGIKPVMLSPKLSIGIKLHYKKSEKIGADRIANAVGGYFLYGGPIIIADFGTAITIDLIDKKGNIAGGAILPGPDLMFDSLCKNTAQLPKAGINAKTKYLKAKDTRSSINVGVIEGICGAVEKIIDKAKEEHRSYRKPIKVIATGGYGSFFKKKLKVIDIYNQDITLVGLMEIYRRM